MKLHWSAWIIGFVLLLPLTSATVNDDKFSIWQNETDIWSTFDLTIRGSPTHQSQGIRDDAWTFDTTDVDGLEYTNYNLPRNDSFTIALWANSTVSTGSSGLFNTMIRWSDAALTDAAVLYWGADGANEIRYTMDSSDGGNYGFDFPWTGEANEWYFFVITFQENDLMKLYINGTQVLNKTVGTNDFLVSSEDFWIGNRDSLIGGQEAFEGTLDEVMIWNRTLTDAEIGDLYNNGNGLFCQYPEPCTFSATITPGDIRTQVFDVQFNETQRITHKLNLSITGINNTRLHNATLEWDGALFPGVIEFNDTDVVIFNVSINTTLIDVNETLFFFNWTWNVTLNDARIQNVTNLGNQSGIFAYGIVNLTSNAVVTEGDTQQVSFDVSRFLDSVNNNNITLTLNGSVRRTNLTFNSIHYSNNITTPLITVISGVNYSDVLHANITFTHGTKTVTRGSTFDETIRILFAGNYSVEPQITETEEQSVSFTLGRGGLIFSNFTLHHNSTLILQNLSPSVGGFWNVSYFTPSIGGDFASVLYNVSLNYSLSLDNRSIIRILSEQQNTTSIAISNCTLSSNPEIVYLSKDEENPTSAVSTLDFEATFTTWATDKAVNKTFGLELNDNDAYGFCFSYTTGNFFVENTVIYTSEDFESRNNFLLNATFSAGDTTNITLFQLNDTVGSNVIIQLTDELDQPLAGHFVEMLRFYPEDKEDSFDGLRTVEMCKSDNDGRCLVHPDAFDIFYAFVVKDPTGKVLLTTSAQKIVQDTINIQVSQFDPFIDTLNEVDAIVHNLSYNPASTTATGFVSDQNNIAQEFTLVGRKFTARGESVVCTTSTTSSSGFLFCDTNNATGNIIFQLSVKRTDGNTNLLEEVEIFDANTTFGINGLLLSIMLIGFISLIATDSPTAFVINTIVGVIISSVLSLMSIPWGIVWFIVAIGIFIISRIRT